MDNTLNGQMDIFDFFNNPDEVSITKPIRLIESFGGVGATAMAFERLEKFFDFKWESWKLIEFDKYPVASYNAIHHSNYVPIDITQIHAKELEIVDRDKYTYIFSYSFPCQDISIAGASKGYSKENQANEETRTRSGLLWEVERLLNECGHELPQILLMENVSQVHSKKNEKDWNAWLKFLDSKGYSSFFMDMNAKHYGVAQNRLRTFCVSILGTDHYEFPKPMELRYIMKDYLEPEVEEKFYINSERAEKLLSTLVENGTLDEYAENSRGGYEPIDLTTNQPRH